MTSREEIIETLKKCKDPEIDVDVWTLGLIYDITIDDKNISIKMTFTTPFCPYGPVLVETIKDEIKKLEGVENVVVDIVFEPPWQPSEELRAMLGV